MHFSIGHFPFVGIFLSRLEQQSTINFNTRIIFLQVSPIYSSGEFFS
jgi:hypothetical protein